MTRSTTPNNRFSNLLALAFATATTCASFAATTDTATAQQYDLGGASNDRGFHQGSARRNMVRFDRVLYAAVVNEDGSVSIRSRDDDLTMTPWATLVGVVNSPTTGFTTVNPTTTVAMAVTRSGCLHITWGCYYYPSFFRQYYRCYRISPGVFTHPPQDITALVGASTLTRTDSMAIAVGANDRVFMTAQNGGISWNSRLLEGNWGAFPTGVAPAWFNRGAISVSASSTNVRMVVDAGNRVHLAFYNNIGSGQYATRTFVSPSAWSPQIAIGVPGSPRDDVGYLASDMTGYTHVLYKHLASTSGSTTNYELLYRRRLGAGPWSAPITVYAFTNTDAAPDNPRESFALAATHKGDRVFAIYREYECRRLMVKQKKFAESDFTFLSELREASTATNDYYMPSVRNTLWPVDNGMIMGHLDISYREVNGTTFDLVHQRLQVGRINVDMTGCPGLCGVPEITFAGVPCAPTFARPLSVGVERARPGAPAFLLLSMDPSYALPWGCGTVHGDPRLPPVIVNPCCNARWDFTLPPGCGSLTFYMQWAIFDPAAVGSWALSNRGQVTL